MFKCGFTPSEREEKLAGMGGGGGGVIFLTGYLYNDQWTLYHGYNKTDEPVTRADVMALKDHVKSGGTVKVFFNDNISDVLAIGLGENADGYYGSLKFLYTNSPNICEAKIT